MKSGGYYHRLTAADRRKVLYLHYTQHISNTRIAESFGVSRHCIGDIIRKMENIKEVQELSEAINRGDLDGIGE